VSQVDVPLAQSPGDETGKAERPAVMLLMLGPHRLDSVLWRGRQPVAGSLRSLSVGDASQAAALAACESLAAAGEAARAAGTRVGALKVMVADSWLMSCSLPWSDALTRPADAGRFARGQLEAAGFVLQPEDQLRLDDGPFGQPRLAVAYPAALLNALGRVARAWGTGLAAVVPLSMVAWEWALEQGGKDRSSPLWVWLPGGMLLLQGGSQLMEVAARVAAGPAEASGQALAMQWQRMCMRNPHLAQATAVRGLNLWPDACAWPQMPVSLTELGRPGPDEAALPALLRLAARMVVRRYAIDAMPAGRHRTSGLARLIALLLLGATAALGLKAWDHWQAGRASDRAWQAAQDQRQAGQRRRAGEPRQEDPARVRAVNAAIRELNLPVSDLMRALQVPRDMRVALLSLDVSSAAAGLPSGSSVKIVAEARSGAEMARYVAHIADRRPIVEAYLTRHEVQESNPERPHRFTVEAAWLP
jgi:hypothetical protein